MSGRVQISQSAYRLAVDKLGLSESKSLNAAGLVLLYGWTVTDAAKRFGTTRQYAGKLVKRIKQSALGEGVCPMCGHRLDKRI